MSESTFMPFPNAEDRAALRAQHMGTGARPANTNALAISMAQRLNPKLGSATTSPMQPASPRVQSQQAAQYGGVEVDPALMAIVEGRAPQAQAPVGPTARPAPRKVEEYPQPEAEWHEPPRPRPMAAPTQGMAENVMPGYQAPISDAEGESIALPSRFAYYPFKDLYVRPFKGGHLAKIARAAQTGSMQPLVEAVDTVVYCSDPEQKNLAFRLTMPDFWFVLHWLRHNSYTKPTYTHSDTCRNPEHLEKVAKGELHKDSLRMKATISSTTLKVHELEFIPNPAEFNLGMDASYELAPPTMRDALEFLEHPLMRRPETRVEFAYLAQKASHVHGVYEYKSLDERVEYVENASAGLALMLDQFATATKGYGVEEFIHMNCKVCGASRKSNIVLDASAFLSAD